MNKRGESIVEVVVACGILSLLFVSVANMIVSSVGLNNDARLRMESVSLAQTRLNDFIVTGGLTTGLDSGSCKISSNAPTSTEPTLLADDTYESTACSAASGTLGLSEFLSLFGKNKCSYITARRLNSDEISSGIDGNNFILVESHVRWVSRTNGADEYIIQKIQRVQ